MESSAEPTILAIDPGSRYCGIAVYNGKYNTMEIEGNYQLVWQLAINGQWSHIVCEDFTAKMISRYGITTVRVIGGIEAICMTRNIPLNRPQAGARIPYKARAEQLLVKIHGHLPPRDHQLSALSHMLRFQDKMLGIKK